MKAFDPDLKLLELEIHGKRVTESKRKSTEKESGGTQRELAGTNGEEGERGETTDQETHEQTYGEKVENV